MKNYLLVLFAFLLLAGCKEAKKNEVAPPPPEPRNVTIEVMLIKKVPEGVTDLKDYIQFYNSRDSVGSIIGKPDEFTTIVYGGYKVKWKGKKFDTLKKPKIKLIKKEKGGDFLNMKGNNKPNSADEIELSVKSKDSVTDKTEIKYSIEIEIDTISYLIDPILKWHPD